MRIYWKPIIFELLLETLLGLAPASLDVLATVAQYVAELSLATGTSIQLVLPATQRYALELRPLAPAQSAPSC